MGSGRRRDGGPGPSLWRGPRSELCTVTSRETSLSWVRAPVTTSVASAPAVRSRLARSRRLSALGWSVVELGLKKAVYTGPAFDHLGASCARPGLAETLKRRPARPSNPSPTARCAELPLPVGFSRECIARPAATESSSRYREARASAVVSASRCPLRRRPESPERATRAAAAESLGARSIHPKAALRSGPARQATRRAWCACVPHRVHTCVRVRRRQARGAFACVRRRQAWGPFGCVRQKAWGARARMRQKAWGVHLLPRASRW